PAQGQPIPSGSGSPTNPPTKPVAPSRGFCLDEAHQQSMNSPAAPPPPSMGLPWPDSMPARDYLSLIGTTPESQINLPLGSLALAMLDRPQAVLGEAQTHLAELGRSVAVAFEAVGRDDVGACSFALAATLSRQEGYEGDREHYDDLANANLIS